MAAYHGDMLHVYVPAELKVFYRAVVESGETVREDRTTLLAAMTPIVD